jgi:hypothetical protein
MPTGNKPGEPPKWKNVTVDADLVNTLGLICTALSEKLGFRPTISQALRYIIRHYERTENK